MVHVFYRFLTIYIYKIRVFILYIFCDVTVETMVERPAYSPLNSAPKIALMATALIYSTYLSRR